MTNEVTLVVFRQNKLDDFLGFSIKFCQENQSKSKFGVLRGLHYQITPHAQTKLVSVIEGSVLDVALDIRKGSPYFGKHLAIELNLLIKDNFNTKRFRTWFYCSVRKLFFLIK